MYIYIKISVSLLSRVMWFPSYYNQSWFVNVLRFDPFRATVKPPPERLPTPLKFNFIFNTNVRRGVRVSPPWPEGNVRSFKENLREKLQLSHNTSAAKSKRKSFYILTTFIATGFLDFQGRPARRTRIIRYFGIEWLN